MTEHTPAEREFIEENINARRFSPAARTMPVQKTLDQYNEANALEPGDEEFLVHPDLEPSTITTADGASIPGYALKSNPAAKVANGNIDLARGADHISRRLGADMGL